MMSTSDFPAAHNDGSGGFLQPMLPSPAPSTAYSASTVTPSTLPQQRSHPLRAGSSKETTLINYIDQKFLFVNRRHAKKFCSAIGGQDEPQTERGYESFREVVKDLESIIDVVWVSGTPSIQIPYLISVAGLVNTYLPDYPFTPRSTFRILKKLDVIFASLLLSEDVETGLPLSGFETRKDIVSMTEKVRIKSIAETSRIAVVEVRDREGYYGKEDEDYDDQTDSLDADDDEHVFDIDDYSINPGRWEMEAARIYERTIQLLGDEFGKEGLPI